MRTRSCFAKNLTILHLEHSVMAALSNEIATKLSPVSEELSAAAAMDRGCTANIVGDI